MPDEDMPGEPEKQGSDENTLEESSLTKEESVQELEEELAEEDIKESMEEPAKEGIPQPDTMPLPPVQPKMTVHEWLYNMRWKANPFTFSISPHLFVGYKSQIEQVLMAIEENHKLMLILGPTGSGKTTFLKWMSGRLKNYDVIYIGKPPSVPADFVTIFSGRYKKSWYAFWQKDIKSIYEIPEFLSKKIRKKRLIVMADEAHEANTEVLEWLRVLNDQVENMSVVVSGLPSLEDQLRNNLETFVKRISTRADLLSLTKEETSELIKKRVQSVGGLGTEFSHVADHIYNYTGGFPREVIRLCDILVNNAIMKGRIHIEFDLNEQKREAKEEHQTASASLLAKTTPMQKEILEMLSTKAMTPGQIANALDLTKYKSRQHAVRSVNNVVKKLQEDGFLERKRDDKAFLYSLPPRISTLFVKR